MTHSTTAETAAAAPSFDDVFRALTASHRRLSDTVAGLSGDQLDSDSYDDDWSIAQVLSHLGSGSEIMALYLASADDTPPGMEQFQAVWDHWNAKSPADQAADALEASAAFNKQLDATYAEHGDDWRIDLFGAERNLVDFATMRLSEHAVHTWDVAVAIDPAAVIDPGAVAIVVDRLGDLIRYTATSDQPIRVGVLTAEPSRSLILVGGPDGLTLEPATEAVTPSIALPAESFVRLVYGRLDPDHTPSVELDGIELDDLRQVFPGP